MNAYRWMSALLDQAGSQPTGGKIRQCPAHRDGSPSLSVREGRTGQVVLRCFAGCSLDEILAALRCAPARLHTPPRMTPGDYAAMVRLAVAFPPVVLRTGSPASRGFRLVAQHDYVRAVLFRWRNQAGAKEVLWETRTPTGGLVPGLIGVSLADLPIYRQAEIRQAVALDEPVVLVESESSVDALRGIYATTWAGSAATIPTARLARLLGNYRRLVHVPDHDPAGRRAYQRLVAAGLNPAVLWPANGQDARDLYTQLGPAAFTHAVDQALNRERQPA